MEIIIIATLIGFALDRLGGRRGNFAEQPCRWCFDNIRHTRKGWVHKKTGKEYGPFVGISGTHPALPDRSAYWASQP